MPKKAKVRVGLGFDIAYRQLLIAYCNIQLSFQRRLESTIVVCTGTTGYGSIRYL